MNSRQRLPDRRHNESFSFKCNELDYTATISRFEDGGIGELFLTNAKADSQSDSNCKDAAIIASLALQYGTPLAVIQKALLRDLRGRASTPVGMAIDLIAANATKNSTAVSS